MQTIKSELEKIQALRRAFEYLADGNQEAGFALVYIKGNYVNWADIFTFLRLKGLRGDKLMEIFKNESSDGGGYLMGMTWILSRMKGQKFGTSSVKINDLR